MLLLIVDLPIPERYKQLWLEIEKLLTTCTQQSAAHKSLLDAYYSIRTELPLTLNTDTFIPNVSTMLVSPLPLMTTTIMTDRSRVSTTQPIHMHLMSSMSGMSGLSAMGAMGGMSAMGEMSGLSGLSGMAVPVVSTEADAANGFVTVIESMPPPTTGYSTTTGFSTTTGMSLYKAEPLLVDSLALQIPAPRPCSSMLIRLEEIARHSPVEESRDARELLEMSPLSPDEQPCIKTKASEKRVNESTSKTRIIEKRPPSPILSNLPVKIARPNTFVFKGAWTHPYILFYTEYERRIFCCP